MASSLLMPPEDPNAIVRGATPNPRTLPIQLGQPGQMRRPGPAGGPPVNPHMDPSAGYGGTLDPGKEYGKGYVDDVLNMLGTHDMGAFQSGPARQRYAEAYNAGMTKPQLDYNKILYERQRDKNQDELAAEKEKIVQDEKDWEKKMLAKSYIDSFRSGDFEGSMAQWTQLSESARAQIISKDTSGSRLPASMIQMDRYIRAQMKEMRDSGASKEDMDEREAWLKELARPKKLTDFGGVPGTIDAQGNFTPATGGTQAEGATTLAEQKATSAAGVDTAKFNVKMKGSLAKNIDSLEKQLDGLVRLRKIVAEGPETGRTNQLATAWSSEHQALDGMFKAAAWNKVIDMKDAGMTFGSFTDTEFTRIAQTLGDIGDRRDANLVKIDNAIKEMSAGYNLFFDRWEDPGSFFEKKRTRWKPTDVRSSEKTISERLKDLPGG